MQQLLKDCPIDLPAQRQLDGMEQLEGRETSTEVTVIPLEQEGKVRIQALQFGGGEDLRF